MHRVIRLAAFFMLLLVGCDDEPLLVPCGLNEGDYVRENPDACRLEEGQECLWVFRGGSLEDPSYFCVWPCNSDEDCPPGRECSDTKASLCGPLCRVLPVSICDW